MSAESNRRVKGYELHERIGIGGFGEVYRAYQPLVDRNVAIKIILPQHANQAEFIRNFEAEARIVARLEHPHIVPLFDFWRDPTGAYLVMRWIRGGSLTLRLESQPLSLTETHPIIDQITQALALAHRNNVVHRDLKPDNILLDEDGNAYLTDFGIATVMGQTQTADSVSGSIQYMAPEQLMSHSPTPRMDIYSCGLLLYEMLTGEYAFGDSNPSEIIQKHLNEPVPTIDHPDIPDEINDIIQKATAKNPDVRYMDIRQIERELQYILQPSVTETVVEDLSIEITNPYKGLSAFDFGDVPDFFGRDELVHQLILRMQDNHPYRRFLSVIGPSGSGKSSVIRAGMIPKLWNGAISGSDQWFYCTMVPSTDPLEQLKAALLSVATTPLLHMDEMLQSNRAGLLWMVDRILGDTTGELLLFIDQFEELFTLVEDESAREQFLALLLAAIEAENSRLRIIITMRADFMDRPLVYLDFGELFRQRTEFIVPLKPSEIEQAITGPAQRVGIVVDTDLVATMVSDLRKEPGALPLLQFVLTELYERRSGSNLTLAAYHQIGGVKGALASRAEEVYQTLSTAEQSVSRQIFLRLITLGEGTDDTRRRIQRSELHQIINNASELQSVLEVFGKHRLLTFDNDSIFRVPTVEVAHEAVIREWQRLRDWLNDTRDDIRLERSLASATVGWLEANRDDSFLLSGTRLNQYADWMPTTNLKIPNDGQQFIEQSLAHQKKLEAEELKRQEHEQEIEQRSRNRLRIIIAVLIIAFSISIALSGLAVQQGYAASISAVTATVAQGEAVVQADLALTQAAIATVAQGDALVQADLAQTQAAIATIAQGQAEQAQATAERQSLEGRSQFWAISSQRLLANGDPLLALSLALEANSISNPSLFARRALSEVAYDARIRHVISAHTSIIWDVDVDPDGTSVLTVSDDELVKLWDISTGTLIRDYRSEFGIASAVSFNKDGTRFVAGYDSGTIVLWDVESGKQLMLFDGHEDRITDLQYSPHDLGLFSSSADGSLMLWDNSSGFMLHQYSGHQSGISAMAVSSDGARLLSSACDDNDQHGNCNKGQLILWERHTGEQLQVIDAHFGSIYGVGFDAVGNLYSGGPIGDLIRWDANTGEQLLRFEGHTGNINSITFTNDGRFMLTGSTDNRIILWDVSSAIPIHIYEGHTGAVLDSDVTSDHRVIVSGDETGQLIIWDIFSGAETRRVNIHEDIINDIVTGGNLAVSASRDSSLILWDTASGDMLKRFVGHNDPVVSVDISTDGKTMISSGCHFTDCKQGEIIVWDVEFGEPRKILYGHKSVVYSVHLSPNERTFLSAGGDGKLILWDIEAGYPLREYKVNDGAITFAQISPDGNIIATTSGQSRTVNLIDVESGQEIMQLKGHTDAVSLVVFSYDSNQLLSASEDNTLILWNIDSGEAVRVLQGHTDTILAIDISPDGKTALSGGIDKSVILWDLEAGEAVTSFNGHDMWVKSVAYLEDGNTAISGDFDGNLIYWRLDNTFDKIITWTYSNREVRELNCLERDQFDTKTQCNDQLVFPTRTPYMTHTPVPTVTPTATINFTQMPATPFATTTPIIPNPAQVVTLTPTLRPREQAIANGLPFEPLFPNKIEGYDLWKYVADDTIVQNQITLIIDYIDQTDSAVTISVLQSTSPYATLQEWVDTSDLRGFQVETINDLPVLRSIQNETTFFRFIHKQLLVTVQSIDGDAGRDIVGMFINEHPVSQTDVPISLPNGPTLAEVASSIKGEVAFNFSPLIPDEIPPNYRLTSYALETPNQTEKVLSLTFRNPDEQIVTVSQLPALYTSTRAWSQTSGVELELFSGIELAIFPGIDQNVYVFVVHQSFVTVISPTEHDAEIFIEMLLTLAEQAPPPRTIDRSQLDEIGFWPLVPEDSSGFIIYNTRLDTEIVPGQMIYFIETVSENSEQLGFAQMLSPYESVEQWHELMENNGMDFLGNDEEFAYIQLDETTWQYMFIRDGRFVNVFGASQEGIENLISSLIVAR